MQIWQWIRQVLLKIQSRHNSVHRRTDRQMDRWVRWNQYTPLSSSLKMGYRQQTCLEWHLLPTESNISHSRALQCILVWISCWFYEALFHTIISPLTGVRIMVHSWYHINGLMPERCNSIANTLELRLSCTKPSIFITTDNLFLHIL